MFDEEVSMHALGLQAGCMQHLVWTLGPKLMVLARRNEDLCTQYFRGPALHPAPFKG